MFWHSHREIFKGITYIFQNIRFCIDKHVNKLKSKHWSWHFGGIKKEGLEQIYHFISSRPEIRSGCRHIHIWPLRCDSWLRGATETRTLPKSSKAFQYLWSLQLSLHTFLLYMTGRGRGGGGQGRTQGAESGRYFSKCPSENGQSWIPLSLVAVLVPQILRCKALREAETYSPPHSCGSEPTAVRLQHMSNLYIWFCRKKNKKTFLECLCMNLNFKLFLFFFFLIITSTELFWEKSYVNIWFISYPGYKRFMCGYSIKISVDWREILWDWGSSITSEFALWMYSVLDLV